MEKLVKKERFFPHEKMEDTIKIDKCLCMIKECMI